MSHSFAQELYRAGTGRYPADTRVEVSNLILDKSLLSMSYMSIYRYN